ncbi:hypothetical protein MMPV_008335 [Pyropia vietnamensis]
MSLTFPSYLALSVAAAAAVFGHATYMHRYLYRTVVHLASSKVATLALGNMLLAAVLVAGKTVQRLFLGSLRFREVERLHLRIREAVIETCLAMTVFRDDFNSHFILMFGLLLFLKVFHWLAKDRIEFLEEQPLSPRSTYIRLFLLMVVLLSVDARLLIACLQYTLRNGRTMVARFAFEFTVLLIELCSHMVRFTLHVVDVACAGRWEGKAMVAFYAELVADALQLVVYVAFFVHVVTFYPLPIHILRDLYVAATRLQRRVVDFMRYRRVVATMAQLFADATAEELAAADATCIICREEMLAAKKLACGHIFHARCLQSWLKRQLSCPTCRAPVDVSPTAHRNAAAAAAAAAGAANGGAADAAGAAANAAVGGNHGDDAAAGAGEAGAVNGGEGPEMRAINPGAGERRRDAARQDPLAPGRYARVAGRGEVPAHPGRFPQDGAAVYEDWVRRAQALQAHHATLAGVLRNLDDLIARNAAGWNNNPAAAAEGAAAPPGSQGVPGGTTSDDAASATPGTAAATAAASTAAGRLNLGRPHEASAPPPAGLGPTHFQWPQQPPQAAPREGGASTDPVGRPPVAGEQPPQAGSSGPPGSLPTAMLARHSQQLQQQQARLYSMRRRVANMAAPAGAAPSYSSASASASAGDVAPGGSGSSGGGPSGTSGGAAGGSAAGRLRHLHYQAPHHPYQPPPLSSFGRPSPAAAGGTAAAGDVAGGAAEAAPAVAYGRWLGTSLGAAPPARVQSPLEARAQALATSALSILLQQQQAALADARRRGEPGVPPPRSGGPTGAAMGAAAAPLGRLLALQESLDRIRAEVSDLIHGATAGEEATATAAAGAASTTPPPPPVLVGGDAGAGGGSSTNALAAATPQAAPAAFTPSFSAAAALSLPSLPAAPAAADDPANGSGGGGGRGASPPTPTSDQAASARALAASAPVVPSAAAAAVSSSSSQPAATAASSSSSQPATATVPVVGGAAASASSAADELDRQRLQVALEAQARYRRTLERRDSGGDGSGGGGGATDTQT